MEEQNKSTQPGKGVAEKAKSEAIKMKDMYDSKMKKINEAVQA